MTLDLTAGNLCSVGKGVKGDYNQSKNSCRKYRSYKTLHGPKTCAATIPMSVWLVARLSARLSLSPSHTLTNVSILTCIIQRRTTSYPGVLCSLVRLQFITFSCRNAFQHRYPLVHSLLGSQ